MKIILAIFLLTLLILFGSRKTSAPETIPVSSRQGGASATFTIGETKIAVEIADDDTERARGLSGRAALGENQGMLFIFDAPGDYGFWMKEMRFPIDIIWIDVNWQIVGITTNVSSNSYPQVFYPPLPIKYVLEVNAGFIAAHNIVVGTQTILH